MPKSRAAYMREYRFRKKVEKEAAKTEDVDFATVAVIADEAMVEVRHLRKANAALTEEVARLKRELAGRPQPSGFNTRPFTPVPKNRK